MPQVNRGLVFTNSCCSISKARCLARVKVRNTSLMVFVTEVSNCQVASVGLQGPAASGLHALGRLVRPRHEGMQYLSRVAHGHHSGRESELYLKAPTLQFHACWGGGCTMVRLPRARLSAKRADKLRWRSLRGSVQGCAFVCVVLLAWRCKHH